jgi:hypothetical protein
LRAVAPERVAPLAQNRDFVADLFEFDTGDFEGVERPLCRKAAMPVRWPMHWRRT